MTALISSAANVAMAAKAQSDAQAEAAEARVLASVGDALTATADEAAAATTAAKAIAGAETIAAIASALASKLWVQVTAGAEQTFATASIDASLTASNEAVAAVHAYVVASIGVNLIASTVATGFALLREHGGINAMTTAQKEAINAASTATLANLAADLTGRNASETLDDPIAIAAATNNAAQAVKAAWQNVNNLQARAASTFAGTGPGGFAMTFAGFTTGVGDFFDGFGSGYWHYLTNPSAMDEGWFRNVQYLAIGTAPVAGGLATGGTIYQGGILMAMPTFSSWLGYGALTTVTTAAATAHISTAAGVATIEIGFVQSITPAFVRAITQTALSQGARSAIINTGPVVENLAIPLGLAAQNGTRVFGGTVTQIQAGFISIFQIFIQRL